MRWHAHAMAASDPLRPARGWFVIMLKGGHLRKPSTSTNGCQ